MSNMTNFKLAGVFALAALLTACGGESDQPAVTACSDLPVDCFLWGIFALAAATSAWPGNAPPPANPALPASRLATTSKSSTIGAAMPPREKSVNYGCGAPM